jgi:2-methylcitrate dehydratase PrpD
MADPAPATALAARFSIPYAAAAALVLGRTDAAAFAPPALGDPRVRALARRVTVRVDPAMSPRRTDLPTARVRVRLRDGRVLEKTVTSVRGDAADPVPAGVVEAKFLGLVAPVLGEARARAVVETVPRLDAMADVRDLTALLGYPPG